MTIETPSGKGAGDENFPVGSFLLPRKLRPHIAKFYAFARAIDDIADNPELEPEDKIHRLNAMDVVVQGTPPAGPGLETAVAMHESLQETGTTSQHCSDLVDAFRQDAVKNRYEDWDGVIEYCLRSASPVGRYLLDIHGESKENYVYADALCNALQVINHVQDCGDDYREMDRVYLPEPWLVEKGATVKDLAGSSACPGVRAVIDRCLEGTRDLLEVAGQLPAHLNSRSLSMESAVILKIANKLVDELSKRDPLAERVVLTKPQYASCAIRGIAKGAFS
ncbi:MAG: squalene synthase HpnC [Hyphomicrobiales bacterium]